MEQSEGLTRKRTALGVACFLVTSILLNFVEIICVGVYFGTILWLLYFTFLKDCLEIFVYATVKCVIRFKWLYRILKINELLYVNVETHGVESNAPRLVQDSVSVQSNSYLVENSPDAVTPCSSVSETLDPSNFSISYSSNSSQSEFQDENRLFAILESPSINSVPSTPFSRMLSSLSTHIISSTNNFNIDETNFEDVDLSESRNDPSAVVPKEESLAEKNPSKWNIGNMKFFNPFRGYRLSTPDGVKSKVENISSKITNVLPHKADDNEKFISKKNDSPDKIGCCTSLPQLFREKYPLSSLTSYARF